MRQVLYILGDLDDDDVEWLLAVGERRRVPAGTVIIDEGRPAGALYLVLDGTFAATTAALGDGEVARFGRGTLAGEMSFVDGLPPSASVVARDDGLVLAIPAELLRGRLQGDSVFAARFYRAVARLLSERLRTNTHMLGRGGGVDLSDDVHEPDELDPSSLDTVYLAGRRFDRILRRLMST